MPRFKTFQDQRFSRVTGSASSLYHARHISRHKFKKLLKFSGCETEVELIPARIACFQTPANIQEMTLFPLHRERWVLDGGGPSGYGVKAAEQLS